MSLVQVDQVECIVELNASIGDTLLMVGGVCIGLKPDIGKPRSKPELRPDWDSLHQGYWAKEDRQILDIIRQHGPIDSRHVCDALNLSVKDPQRLRIQHRIRGLLAKGIIARFHEDKHKSHARWIIA